MRWAVVIVPLCWCTLDTTPPYEVNVRSTGSSANDEGYKIASEILRNSINFSVDPCEDFFEFACGNWVARHPLPPDEVSYDQFRRLKDKMQEEIRSTYVTVRQDLRLL
ncbi:unnamed protein product [Cylicostephanus goldi]|uniref:Peptidase M13 N-terminal domain-containing protein n=1 Tax=Cylicostephanus goldi TaxID=71465 RepID=A0A3P7PLU6_CYLGO|nr:unnamed protein product [Cylicostephanus goldi]